MRVGGVRGDGESGSWIREGCFFDILPPRLRLRVTFGMIENEILLSVSKRLISLPGM